MNNENIRMVVSDFVSELEEKGAEPVEVSGNRLKYHKKYSPLVYEQGAKILQSYEGADYGFCIVKNEGDYDTFEIRENPANPDFYIYYYCVALNYKAMEEIQNIISDVKFNKPEQTREYILAIIKLIDKRSNYKGNNLTWNDIDELSTDNISDVKSKYNEII